MDEEAKKVLDELIKTIYRTGFIHACESIKNAIEQLPVVLDVEKNLPSIN